MTLVSITTAIARWIEPMSTILRVAARFDLTDFLSKDLSSKLKVEVERIHKAAEAVEKMSQDASESKAFTQLREGSSKAAYRMFRVLDTFTNNWTRERLNVSGMKIEKAGDVLHEAIKMLDTAYAKVVYSDKPEAVTQLATDASFVLSCYRQFLDVYK